MSRNLIFSFIFGVAVTAVLIYGTSLRYTDLIEPKITDVDPVTFYGKYQMNPDHYIFIDVRSESAYNKVHAKGSINVPLSEMYDYRHALPKKDKEIALICSGGRASGVAFAYLQHYGFTNMFRLDGGIENWIDKKLPTESALGTTSSSAVSYNLNNYICV